MDKVNQTTPDLTDAHVRQLADLFPSVVTEIRHEDGTVERAVDFDALRQELSDHVVEGPQERYHLDWPGKRAARLAANAPIAKTLRPDRAESVEFDTTQNLFIEGDNLEALKLLQESYLGKVKLIYIDPPYNTGNDFVYNDDFAESAEDYLLRSGQVSNAGERLVANKETNGRFHSDWLSMMYPRLTLARSFLHEEGAIFLSIDDNEMASLKLLCDEVFGPQNFIGTVVWSGGRKNDSRFLSVSHEYVLCYARDATLLRERGITWKVQKKGLDAIESEVKKLRQKHGTDFAAATAELKKWYSALPEGDPAKRHKHYSRIDARGVFFADNISWPGGGGPSYDVLHPVTGKPVKKPSRGWLFQKPRFEQMVAEDRVFFGPDETSVPTFKRYLSDTDTEVAYSVIYQDGRAASKRLRTLMGGPLFDFPKDETVLQTFIDMVTSGEDIVMDFFAGSASTGHAVMQQNAADGGQRRYILVQLNESTAADSAAAQAGHATIAGVSRERLRRATAQIQESSEASAAHGQDFGFRALRIDTPNMRDTLRTAEELGQFDLHAFEDSVKSDRTAEDVLFQVLLDWGLDLASPLEHLTLAGADVIEVDAGAVLACFDSTVTMELVQAMAQRQPARLVFRDSAFASDADRINAEQIVREYAPGADIKVL